MTSFINLASKFKTITSWRYYNVATRVQEQISNFAIKINSCLNIQMHFGNKDHTSNLDQSSTYNKLLR